ncbi:RloB family protein [Leifsonia sp. L25]|uniref:RloB family protein n=1 Tax=Actinomycetes TaxID=1760 RepID=UPI003D68D3AB
MQWVKQQTHHHPIALEPMPTDDPLKNIRFARERATIAREQGAAYDEVWCVFDRLPDGVAELVADSSELSGVRLVDNTPNFELWLLLHFADLAPGTSPEVQLVKFLPGYQGALAGDESALQGRYDHARLRATALPPSHGHTNTFSLVDSVLQSYEDFKGDGPATVDL